jgi:hypothetical protein
MVASVGTSADSGISEILRDAVQRLAVGHTITTRSRKDLGRKDARRRTGMSNAHHRFYRPSGCLSALTTSGPEVTQDGGVTIPSSRFEITLATAN